MCPHFSSRNPERDVEYILNLSDVVLQLSVHMSIYHELGSSYLVSTEWLMIANEKGLKDLYVRLANKHEELYGNS